MKLFRRSLAIVLLSASSLFPALHLFAATAVPTSGRTQVDLSEQFVGALGSLGVTPAALAPGVLNPQIPRVRFPITWGAYDLETSSGEVDHTGGLSLTAGNTAVQLSGFIIDLSGTTPILTGLVIAEGKLLGRVPLFNLVVSSSSTVEVKPQTLKILNVGVELTQEAATALNGVFNVSAFTPGFPIGNASLFARGLQIYTQ